MLNKKSFTDFTSLFSQNIFKENDKKILEHFQWTWYGIKIENPYKSYHLYQNLNVSHKNSENNSLQQFIIGDFIEIHDYFLREGC